MTRPPSVLIHGGAGTPESWSDGCEQAAEVALASLAENDDALEAATAAAVSLENDGRFNAGWGSTLRLDGETVEMDASLMTSDGRIGAVAAIPEVIHPIRVAREVLDCPHILLAGEGALRFAQNSGLEVRPDGPPPRVRERFERTRKKIEKAGDLGAVNVRWQGVDGKRLWNFPDPAPNWLPGCDTIGAVVRDSQGRLAVSNSTGGAVPMLSGRVGDSPLPGAGFWCGPEAAVCATGIGEEITKHLVSKTVYDWLAEGVSPEEACARAVALFPETIHFGLIVLTATGGASGSNTTMAQARA